VENVAQFSVLKNEQKRQMTKTEDTCASNMQIVIFAKNILKVCVNMIKMW